MTQVFTAARRNDRAFAPLSSFAASLFATMVAFSTFSAEAQTTEKVKDNVRIKVITVQDGKTVANSASSLEEALNNPAIKEALQKANIDLKNLENKGNAVNICTNSTAGNGNTSTVFVNSGEGDTKAHCVVVNCSSKNGENSATAVGGNAMRFIVTDEDDAQIITEDMIKELKADNGSVMIGNSDDDASFSPTDATAPKCKKVMIVRVNNDATATTEATTDVAATTEATAPVTVQKTVLVRVNRPDGNEHTSTVTNNVKIVRSVGMGKTMSSAECVAVCKGKGVAMARCSGNGSNAAKATVATKETPAQPSGALQLSAYPNPTHGEFTLTFTAKDPANTTVTVTDLSGRTVYSEQLTNFSGDYTKSLNLTEQPKGNYLVKVSQGGASAVANIVIE